MGLSFLLAGLTTGCDGADGGQGGTGDPIAAYEEMIQQACERQVECGYPVLNEARSVEGCVEMQMVAAGELKPTLGDGAVILREDRLRDCTAALAAGTCQQVAILGVEIDPACKTFWEGTVEEGGECRGGVANDCQEGLVCVFDGQTCPGTCAAPEPPCVEGSCPEGEYCNDTARCVEKAEIGQACGSTAVGALHENACVAGAHCVDGTCAPRVAAGEACTGNFEFECIEEHVCQCAQQDCSTGTICVPAPGADEPCNASSGCAEGRFCNFETGTCKERGGEGEACPVGSYGACQPGLACAEGTCEKPGGGAGPLPPLLASGDDCTTGGICPLGDTCLCKLEGCQGGEKQCKPGPRLGESCQEAAQTDFGPFACGEGICDIFETYTCVTPGAAGDPCTGTFTFACGSGVCIDGACADMEQTRCE